MALNKIGATELKTLLERVTPQDYEFFADAESGAVAIATHDIGIHSYEMTKIAQICNAFGYTYSVVIDREDNRPVLAINILPL